jgi:hypothetical protein
MEGRGERDVLAMEQGGKLLVRKTAGQVPWFFRANQQITSHRGVSK